MVNAFKTRRPCRKEAPKKKNKKLDKVNEMDEYWKEISAKCVDAESIRVQEELLHSAVVLLENVSIYDASSVHIALDRVHTTSKIIAMLKG